MITVMDSSNQYTHEEFKKVIINLSNDDGKEDVLITILPNECSITIEHYSSGQEEPYEKRKINW